MLSGFQSTLPILANDNSFLAIYCSTTSVLRSHTSTQTDNVIYVMRKKDTRKWSVRNLRIY